MTGIRKILSIILLLCFYANFVPEQKAVAVNNMIHK